MDKLLMPALLLLLGGCATVPQQSYIGKTKQQLIDGRGLADMRQEEGNGEIWQYKQCQAARGALIGNAVVTRQDCYKIIYRIENDVVVSGHVIPAN